MLHVNNKTVFSFDLAWLVVKILTRYPSEFIYDTCRVFALNMLSEQAAAAAEGELKHQNICMINI